MAHPLGRPVNELHFRVGCAWPSWRTTRLDQIHVYACAGVRVYGCAVQLVPDPQLSPARLHSDFRGYLDPWQYLNVSLHPARGITMSVSPGSAKSTACADAFAVVSFPRAHKLRLSSVTYCTLFSPRCFVGQYCFGD